MRTGLAASLVFVLAATSQAADLKIGDPAPNFKLQASDGKTYQLSDYLGKQAVVLAWFPKAFTGGCTIECKSLSDNSDKIRSLDVSYFMASVDPVDKNTAFANATKIKIGGKEIVKKVADFPLLSDPAKETAKAYGVLNVLGFADRWTFYIDKSGKIAWIDKSVKPETSAEDMLARLTALKVPMMPKN